MGSQHLGHENFRDEYVILELFFRLFRNLKFFIELIFRKKGWKTLINVIKNQNSIYLLKPADLWYRERHY